MKGMRTGETPIQYAERLLKGYDELLRKIAKEQEKPRKMHLWQDDNERLRKQNERLKRALREYGRAENWHMRIEGVRPPQWVPADRLGIPAWEDPTHLANLALGRQPG